MKIYVTRNILDCDQSKLLLAHHCRPYSCKDPLYFMQVAWITC